MNSEKYIGYLESQIADTMWPRRTSSIHRGVRLNSSEMARSSECTG